MPHPVPVEEVGLTADSKTPPPHAVQEPVHVSSAPNCSAVWNQTTITALAALVVLWAVKLYTTWGAWGSLTVDSGREMYVPWALSQGKQLYRDVWFPYGPAAPYFTSYLYRLCGARLDVLYWVGSLSALGSAIFLYLTGIRLSCWIAGWASGAIVLMEAFQPSPFCFPLPYASASVYGCLIGCLFLYLAVSAAFRETWPWMFGAGTAAAFALLLKLEFGIACYGALALLIAVRAIQSRSGKRFALDLATALPGVILCGLVIRWMVSIAGAEFITQENFMAWPTAYFMRAYGKPWMERGGFMISRAAFLGALHQVVPIIGVLAAAYLFLRWKAYDTRSLLVRALILFALVLYFVKENYFLLAMKEALTLLLTMIFFPPDMVLYVIVAAVVAACICLWRRAPRDLAVTLIFVFSGLLAFRVLMKTNSSGYSIFYNGPVVLSYLLLLFLVIPRTGRSRRFVLVCEAAICLLVLAPVFLRTRARDAEARDYVPLSTERGTIRVSPNVAAKYTAAIQFMKEKASRGQSVLSVPEDTSLYFLSGVECPTRILAFTPGLVAPGKMMDGLIQEIEHKQVRYLVWSNRTFPEYGASVFGVDFSPELGNYFNERFHRVGQLLPGPVDAHKLDFVIWERN